MADAQRFCQFCGAAAQAGAIFCRSCGRPLGSSAEPALPDASLRLAVMAPDQQIASWARKRPLWVVFLLTAGTLTIYFFVHLGLVWAEMKRIREDRTMNPVGHAFAQLVPIYGWYRYHAHMQTIGELLESVNSPKRVAAGQATLVYVAVTIFGTIAANPDTPDWLVLPSYAAFGVIAARRQNALNAYYDQVSGGRIPQRVNGFEWVVMTAGAILLILAAIGFLLPAIR